MKIEIPYSFFFFLILTLNVHAQPSKDLASYLRDVKKNKNLGVPKSVTDPSNAEAVIALLEPYLGDTSSFVRSKSLQILTQVGKSALKVSIRRHTVQLLVSKFKTHEHSVLITALKKFHREDFETSATDSLIHFLEAPSNQKGGLIRIIGFVGAPASAEKLRKFSTVGNPQSIRWSALLAMARLGDVEALESIMQRVRKLKVNDETVNQLFPDLVYTRQKQVYDYLIEVLNSEQANCESADNDHPTAILCGYRVMEQLAPAIKDYPLALDASGDIKTNDYKKSLEVVRNWFKKNSGNYLIDNSTF